MIEVIFSPQNIENLHYERFHHQHPLVQKKMEALYLKSQKLAHKDICRLCKITEPTLVVYLKQYNKGGIELLKQINYKGQQSELNKHSKMLKKYFKANPPRNTEEAKHAIEKLTGIKRSPTQVREFLKRIGMKCHKVGSIPAKAVTTEKKKEQESFKKKELMPRLNEAKKGKRIVFFVDAAHFVYGAFLGYLWYFVRLFIQTPSGRKRFNVLGALNAITKEIITVTNETYINSNSVCQLLNKIKALNYKEPITLVLDNARYQRCKLVQSYAELLNIELLFLPSYSPNLNLIERLWRFIKKECLYSKYYESFIDFKQAIEVCIEQSNTVKKEKLEPLLSLKFQSFKKVKVLSV